MTQPGRPEDLRVSDAERTAVQRYLQRAHDTGQLGLDEFDDRVRLVWASRTRADLDRVTADLPALPPPGQRPAVFSDTAGGTAMRVLTVVWAALTALNLAIWSILALTVGWVHPWWLWVAGPPGAVLAVLYAAGIGRPHRG